MTRSSPSAALAGALIEDQAVLPRLRELAPSRPITWSEAHSVAERQATLLLEMLFITEPPVPQFAISSLPGIVVDRRPGWPTSGMAVRARSHWRIVLRADETRQRQRFSLAHEFKHVLDDPVIDRMHAHLAAEQRDRRAERLCNHFAACLLMPRPWVKRDWCSGIQNIRALARRYYVSTHAMSTRLSELGLVPLTSAFESSQRHSSITQGGAR